MEERRQRVFFALSDATRRELIERLSIDGEKTATELAGELPITRQGIAKHLGILADAGLVITEKEGREKRYAVNLDPLDETVSWVEAVQSAWDKRLHALRDYLLSDSEEEDLE